MNFTSFPPFGSFAGAFHFRRMNLVLLGIHANYTNPIFRRKAVRADCSRNNKLIGRLKLARHDENRN